MKGISIIIPTLNEASYLPRVLDAISIQKTGFPIEVIVVDGCSEDGTAELAETYKRKIQRLSVISTKNRGVGRQRNLGAVKAHYDYLLFLDSDVYMPSGFLNRLQKKIPPAGDFVALVLHRPPRYRILDYLWLVVLFSFIWLVQWFKPICSGSFLLTTKSNHKRVGGFDEEIVMAEDVVYCHESIKQGATYKLLFSPSVIGDPRRLRKTGRLKLLYFWLKGYLYTITKGPIYESNRLFDYEFGNHQKKLIVGLGSGRSGTASLAYFLDSQADAYIVHESSFGLPAFLRYTVGNYMPWNKDILKLFRWHDSLTYYSKNKMLYGDVCSSLIQYVPDIYKLNANVVFVCMRRDKEEVVKSFEELTVGSNHWQLNKLSKYVDYWYDMYPKYDGLSKTQSINCYWEEYYLKAECYQAEYSNFKIFDLEDLNSDSGRNAILQHIGVSKIDRIVEGEFHLNKSIPVALSIFLRVLSVPRNLLRKCH